MAAAALAVGAWSALAPCKKSLEMVRRSQRVSFPGGLGFELAGIVDVPNDAPQATVVFTHCFTCNKDLKAIVRISRGLAEAGYLVLRYDLTGLGGSQGDFSRTHFSSNRDDLLPALRARRIFDRP